MPQKYIRWKYKIHQKTMSKQGPDKVKVKWRQSNHNLDLNYNLMGFDTIEINLVSFLKCSAVTLLRISVQCPDTGHFSLSTSGKHPDFSEKSC